MDNTALDTLINGLMISMCAISIASATQFILCRLLIRDKLLKIAIKNKSFNQLNKLSESDVSSTHFAHLDLGLETDYAATFMFCPPLSKYKLGIECHFNLI